MARAAALASAAAAVAGATGPPRCPAPLPAGQTLAVTQTEEQLDDRVRGRKVPAHVFRPANATPPFPLVSVGHGASMGATGYDYLGKALAARGYVVAAFDEYSTKGTALDYMLDIAAVRDSLYNASADASSPFAGLLCDKAVAAGHSLGGGSQFASADRSVMRDCGNSLPNASGQPCAAGGYTADFAGLAALSGGFIVNGSTDPFAPKDNGSIPEPYDSAPRLTIPAMFVSGTADCLVKAMTEDYPAYASMARSPCRIFANVTGADHCQWAGLGGLERSACVLAEGMGGKGCKPSLTAAQQQAVAVSYVSTFFDFVTKGDAASKGALFQRLDADAASGAAIYESVC